jgi:hypothetical protein
MTVSPPPTLRSAVDSELNKAWVPAGQRCFFAVVAVKSGALFATQSTNLRTLGLASSIMLQFGIGEIGDERLLANGVHGYNIAPAAALGHWMVPDDRLAGRSATEPAEHHRRHGLRLALQFAIGIVF